MASSSNASIKKLTPKNVEYSLIFIIFHFNGTKRWRTVELPLSFSHSIGWMCRKCTAVHSFSLLSVLRSGLVWDTERERDGTAWFGVDGIFQYKSGKWISFYFPFNENCRHVWFTALKNGFSIFALQHKNATIMVLVTVKARSWSLASSNWKDWHEDEKKHIHTQLPTKEPSSPCTCNDKTNKMSYLTC